MTNARRLTLIDLVAAIGAAALALAWLRRVAPGRIDVALILVGPLAGILWQRWRGGRGILGGAMGGAAYAAVGLFDFATGALGSSRPGPSTVAKWPLALPLMMLTCVACGAAIGLAAWLGASAMGRPRAPRPGPRPRMRWLALGYRRSP